MLMPAALQAQQHQHEEEEHEMSVDEGEQGDHVQGEESEDQSGAEEDSQEGHGEGEEKAEDVVSVPEILCHCSLCTCTFFFTSCATMSKGNDDHINVINIELQSPNYFLVP